MKNQKNIEAKNINVRPPWESDVSVKNAAREYEISRKNKYINSPTIGRQQKKLTGIIIMMVKIILGMNLGINT
ncbi:hypothetical protein [Francisella frigiditurris]|uniref:Uncharacterized protein n=1 Tax=Francisella frigiditurris TaxID=1542390 RepID=A0A1J0KVZ2_9GAMM|nr:hypothetical protein [Francisella frigiditurris]APC97788.1 hypothetical protein KX01_721 [Francisella frigiditurris]